MLIIHHNDNDGKLGAVICSKYGGDGKLPTEFLEMDYRDTFNPHEHIDVGERVIIVDFSIKPDEMMELLSLTDDVIWLDHHKTAIDMYKDFPHKIDGVRREGDRAGCLLAWNYFNLSLCAPLVVQLISDYDTWTLNDPRSKPLNYGMQAVDTSPIGGTWQKLLDNDDEVLRYVAGGEFVLGFARQRGKEMADSYGHFADLDGFKIFVMHNPNPGMDWFWLLRNNGADAFARVAFDGKQYSVSLYSETIDVSDICKTYGGGGHPSAAGFSREELPWSVIDG